MVLYRRADYHYDMWTCVSPLSHFESDIAHIRLAITARIWSNGMSLVKH